MATSSAAPDGRLLDALVQVSFAIAAIVGKVGARHDLSLTQVRLLAILDDREPRMSDLARHLGLDRSSVSGLIDRAAVRGLVERIADPVDARASRVTLTPAGRELAKRGRSEIAERVEPLVAGLAAGERGRLATLLEGILRT
jgi:DNA-binding MarR family transcriptional regulator